MSSSACVSFLDVGPICLMAEILHQRRRSSHLTRIGVYKLDSKSFGFGIDFWKKQSFWSCPIFHRKVRKNQTQHYAIPKFLKLSDPLQSEKFPGPQWILAFFGDFTLQIPRTNANSWTSPLSTKKLVSRNVWWQQMFILKKYPYLHQKNEQQFLWKE